MASNDVAATGRTSSALTALEAQIAVAGSLDRKIEVLLAGLADQVKAVSNDQNVQRLARDLRAATPSLVEAFRIANR